MSEFRSTHHHLHAGKAATRRASQLKWVVTTDGDASTHNANHHNHSAPLSPPPPHDRPDGDDGAGSPGADDLRSHPPSLVEPSRAERWDSSSSSSLAANPFATPSSATVPLEGMGGGRDVGRGVEELLPPPRRSTTALDVIGEEGATGTPFATAMTMLPSSRSSFMSSFDHPTLADPCHSPTAPCVERGLTPSSPPPTAGLLTVSSSSNTINSSAPQSPRATVVFPPEVLVYESTDTRDDDSLCSRIKVATMLIVCKIFDFFLLSLIQPRDDVPTVVRKAVVTILVLLIPFMAYTTPMEVYSLTQRPKGTVAYSDVMSQVDMFIRFFVLALPMYIRLRITKTLSAGLYAVVPFTYLILDTFNAIVRTSNFPIGVTSVVYVGMAVVGDVPLSWCYVLLGIANQIVFGLRIAEKSSVPGIEPPCKELSLFRGVFVPVVAIIMVPVVLVCVRFAHSSKESELRQSVDVSREVVSLLVNKSDAAGADALIHAYAQSSFADVALVDVLRKLTLQQKAVGSSCAATPAVVHHPTTHRPAAAHAPHSAGGGRRSGTGRRADDGDDQKLSPTHRASAVPTPRSTPPPPQVVYHGAASHFAVHPQHTSLMDPSATTMTSLDSLRLPPLCLKNGGSMNSQRTTRTPAHTSNQQPNE